MVYHSKFPDPRALHPDKYEADGMTLKKPPENKKTQEKLDEAPIIPNYLMSRDEWLRLEHQQKGEIENNLNTSYKKISGVLSYGVNGELGSEDKAYDNKLSFLRQRMSNYLVMQSVRGKNSISDDSAKNWAISREDRKSIFNKIHSDAQDADQHGIGKHFFYMKKLADFAQSKQGDRVLNSLDKLTEV